MKRRQIVAALLQLAGLAGGVTCGFLIAPLVGGICASVAAVFVGLAAEAH